MIEPEAVPLVAEAPAPRGRFLRSKDGEATEAPAFLQPRAPRPVEAEAEVPAAKPRRRKAPRSFEDGEAPAPAPADED